MEYPHARLLVFAKAPVPGQAKSRLVPVLGADGAARLHARLVRRALATATAARLCPVELWCSPACDHPYFSALEEEFAATLHVQQGDGLGARMDHALNDALMRASGPAILIGTDCPAIDADYLREAVGTLDRGCDAIIGPALDGGYVLVGLKAPAPSVFKGVDWGTERVLGQTRERLSAAGMAWRELAALPDIDRPEDLALLPRE